MCHIFFHKLFCLLQSVIIAVFWILEKGDISGCRSCSNVCVYLRVYNQPKMSQRLELNCRIIES